MIKYKFEDDRKPGVPVRGDADYIAGFMIEDGEIAAFSGGNTSANNIAIGFGNMIQDLIHSLNQNNKEE